MEAYPLLSLSVEGIIFSYAQNSLKVLLQLNNEKTFRNKWSLPFQLVKANESIEMATEKLQKKLGKFSIIGGYQSAIYSNPKRHPKTRIISVAKIFFAKSNAIKVSDPSFKWFDLNEVPPLIMDHSIQLKDALEFLKTNTHNETFVFHLLPNRFTLTEIQECLECFYGFPLDKRNFRKKILSYGVLKPTREKEKDVAHKPAILYTVDKRKLKKFQSML